MALIGRPGTYRRYPNLAAYVMNYRASDLGVPWEEREVCHCRDVVSAAGANLV